MRSVYLGDLRFNVGYQAINWLSERYGPGNSIGSRWSLRELAYVDFVNDRDADFFLVMWT